MLDPGPPLSLAQARKAFARDHICAAARELFFQHGYGATTFDQIAHAAGTRRTTIYSHFADKAEILAAIGEDYNAGLCAVVETLPGPAPSRDQIDAWLGRLVTFVVSERIPAMLLIGMGIGHEAPPVVEPMSRRFGEALAARLPAFAVALDPGPTYAADRARTKVVLRELSLACLAAAREAPDWREELDLAAELFERFVHGRF